MRAFVKLIACAGVALTVAGCDPFLEQRYVNEGAGVDLYTADRASQVDLMDQYVAYLCAQVGSNCIVNSQTFVQAGMNDIDQRCDGFLTWLDARRRDKEPVLAELAAVGAATHDIMTVTGAAPKSLNIVATAFGLAAATYSNWNSRLLISVNQSTVQEVVYKSQWQFREKARNFPIPDRPTSIYLLRNYLRLCMPITIEAAINTTTTLVQRDAAAAATQSLVVATTTPMVLRQSIPLSPRAPLPLPGGGGRNPPPPAGELKMAGLTDTERNIPQSVGEVIQSNLCIISPYDELLTQREMQFSRRK